MLQGESAVSEHMHSGKGLLSDHRFVVHRAADSEEQEGLRAFFSYRDLGIEAATHGAFAAHVIRAKEAISEPMAKHRHELGFQMVYVLKGACVFWYDGHGDVALATGDCVYQPPGIVHRFVSCSEDCELLEITMPARFKTEEVEPTQPGTAA